MNVDAHIQRATLELVQNHVFIGDQGDRRTFLGGRLRLLWLQGRRRRRRADSRRSICVGRRRGHGRRSDSGLVRDYHVGAALGHSVLGGHVADNGGRLSSMAFGFVFANLKAADRTFHLHRIGGQPTRSTNNWGRFCGGVVAAVVLVVVVVVAPMVLGLRPGCCRLLLVPTPVNRSAYVFT